MGQLNLSEPVVGQPDATEDPKIPSNFTAIQAVINGGIDATNISAALAQAATVNQAGQVMKGAVNIPTSQTTSSATYTTLSTPDQVTGIVLPTNGLIRVWYQATWQESVALAARAAIFVGTNQLKVASATPPLASAAVTQAAARTINSFANTNDVLCTTSAGLVTLDGVAGYTGDATTGQVVGGWVSGTSSTQVGMEIAGVASQIITPYLVGGPCYIFATAGTYTVSVQFKTSSGSVTASNRKLWVQAISFA